MNPKEVDEVLVRDKELDVPYFLPEKEAKREEIKGKVVIQHEKETKPKQSN